MAKKLNENEIKKVAGGKFPTLFYYTVIAQDASNNVVEYTDTGFYDNQNAAKQEKDSIVKNIFASRPNAVRCVSYCHKTGSGPIEGSDTVEYRK